MKIYQDLDVVTGDRQSKTLDVAEIYTAEPPAPEVGDLWLDSAAQSEAVMADSAVGGDLTGTLPNPQIAPGSITDNDIALNAAIGTDKLAAVEALHVIGDPGEIAFQNSFFALTGANAALVGFWKERGMLHLQGIIRNNTVANYNLAMFTLPTTHRPAKEMVMESIIYNQGLAVYQHAILTVYQSGVVAVATIPAPTGTHLFVYLTGKSVRL